MDVHWDRKRPLLLGYSGGFDSKALLYTLLECGIPFHIAHVDHGWREESAMEALQIKQEAEQLGIPFFSTRLEGVEKTEDAARIARLQFFKSLGSDYQALLLAHQADDLAETILKRILEGAHMANWVAMQEVSQHYGMTIFRPFLKVKRSSILEFIKDRGLEAFTDFSNLDPAYLRVRMRQEIFPFLNASFGKQTQDNLVLLQARALELREYLDRKVEAIQVHKGPWGSLADLNGVEKLEQSHFLQKMGRQLGIVLGRDHLETLLTWLEQGQMDRSIVVKTVKICVDQGRVCFL